MAWFIQFYQKIPAGTLPRDENKYAIGNARQLDQSSPSEKKPCPSDEVEKASQRGRTLMFVVHN
jgi:hypothetical protein